MANPSDVLTESLAELIQSAKNLGRSENALSAARANVESHRATFDEKANHVAAMLRDEQDALSSAEVIVARAVIEQLQGTLKAASGTTDVSNGAARGGPRTHRSKARRYSAGEAQDLVRAALTGEPRKYREIETKVREGAPSIAKSAIRTALGELRANRAVEAVGERRGMAYRLK